MSRSAGSRGRPLGKEPEERGSKSTERSVFRKMALNQNLQISTNEYSILPSVRPATEAALQIVPICVDMGRCVLMVSNIHLFVIWLKWLMTCYAFKMDNFILQYKQNIIYNIIYNIISIGYVYIHSSWK